MPAKNPLGVLLADSLPQCDFAVLSNGFLKHGRDYGLVIQDCVGLVPGTYRLTFTHVVAAKYETALTAAGWVASWGDVFLDWEASKDLEGYIWGTNWTMAYPGWAAPETDVEASDWAARIGHSMHRAVLETDRFNLHLVFHDARVERISDDTSLIRQVVHPLA